MRGRNAFGGRLPAHLVEEYGGDPALAHRVTFRVVPMGDHNAVDIAQAVHMQVLRDAGLCDPTIFLEWGSPSPMGDLLEGLYIDDHIVASIVPRGEMGSDTGADRDFIGASHVAYSKAGLPRSEEKSVGCGRTKGDRRRGDGTFTAWGKRVRSEEGTVGVPA